jgi:hypothetical protein
VSRVLDPSLREQVLGLQRKADPDLLLDSRKALVDSTLGISAGKGA